MVRSFWLVPRDRSAAWLETGAKLPWKAWQLH
jgi:hypothetical protein